jgi:hypothetical protein
LCGAVVGILVGMSGLLLAAQNSCGLCTHITIAQMFFPYALIADPSLSNHALDAFLAGLQWPLYGAIMGIALTSLPKRKSLVVVGILVVVHVLSVVGANRRVNDWWEFKRLGRCVVRVSAAI